MKYGLVLGNPVVSLHRLRPPSTLAAIDQQSESEGFSTDTENETNEDGLPDAISDVGTASGRQSPNSPVPSRTSSVIGSPIRPRHTVAELTLSVPVLQVQLIMILILRGNNNIFIFQSIEAAVVTPKKRSRPSERSTKFDYYIINPGFLFIFLL